MWTETDSGGNILGACVNDSEKKLRSEIGKALSECKILFLRAKPEGEVEDDEEDFTPPVCSPPQDLLRMRQEDLD